MQLFSGTTAKGRGLKWKQRSKAIQMSSSDGGRKTSGTGENPGHFEGNSLGGKLAEAKKSHAASSSLEVVGYREDPHGGGDRSWDNTGLAGIKAHDQGNFGRRARPTEDKEDHKQRRPHRPVAGEIRGTGQQRGHISTSREKETAESRSECCLANRVPQK